MSDKSPSISVVIPCFRAGELLAPAIESVLAQTEEDWELILVDNNASEETKEVISKYARLFPEKIRRIWEEDQGLCSARNRGISESQGEFIALLDDDDQMYPERLALQKEALSDHPEAVLCFGGIDWVSYDDKTVVKSGERDADFPFFPESSVKVKETARLRFPEPRPSSVMVRRSITEEVGGFDRHFNPFFLEESDFYFRIAQKGSFVEVNRPVIRFRMPSPEFLKKKRIDNVRKFRLILNQDYFFSKIIKFLKEKNLLENPYIQRDIKRMRARWLREISFDFLATPGGEKLARLLLWRAIREWPSDLKSVKHLIRSFFPFPTRVRRYRSQQVYEEGIPSEITEDFLLSLFNGDHHCPFCESSSSSIGKSEPEPLSTKQNQIQNDPFRLKGQ